MLVIKVELWPHGDETRAQEIATGVIGNDGSGNWQYGNYNVVLSNNGECDPHGMYEQAVAQDKQTRVEKFYRDSGVWKLLRVALNAVHAR